MSKFTDRIDMRFLYTPSGQTDVRKTFNRVRRQLAEQKAKRDAEDAAVKQEQVAKVRGIKGAK